MKQLRFQRVLPLKTYFFLLFLNFIPHHLEVEFTDYLLTILFKSYSIRRLRFVSSLLVLVVYYQIIPYFVLGTMTKRTFTFKKDSNYLEKATLDKTASLQLENRYLLRYMEEMEATLPSISCATKCFRELSSEATFPSNISSNTKLDR